MTERNASMLSAGLSQDLGAVVSLAHDMSDLISR